MPNRLESEDRDVEEVSDVSINRGLTNNAHFLCMF